MSVFHSFNSFCAETRDLKSTFLLEELMREFKDFSAGVIVAFAQQVRGSSKDIIAAIFFTVAPYARPRKRQSALLPKKARTKRRIELKNKPTFKESQQKAIKGRKRSFSGTFKSGYSMI